MLPFLDKKRMAGSIVAKRGKMDVTVKPEVEAVGGEMDPAMKAAAEDVMRAIESKSVLDLAKALRAAFMICDSMPHVEGEHE